MIQHVIIFFLLIPIISFGQITSDSIQKIRIYDAYSVGGHLQKKPKKQLKELNLNSLNYIELDTSDVSLFSTLLKNADDKGYFNVVLGRYTFGQIFYKTGLIDTFVFTGYGQIYNVTKNKIHVIKKKEDYDWIVKLYNDTSDKLK